MKCGIDENSQPIYLQIYRLLREDIIGEGYPRNTRRPSKRLLADELGISTVTVSPALRVEYKE